MTISHIAQATHIRAGEITIRRTNCSNTVQITFTGYRDTGSSIVFGQGYLDFGDGSDPMFIKEEFFTKKTLIGNGIEKNVFSISHTFPSQGLFIISYRELNRNAGTLNIDNSVETPFYVESQIIIDSFIGCNDSPELLVSPVDEGCTQVAFYHNPGAFDPDGDSLSYEFTIPKQDRGFDVGNYRDLDANESGFYPNGYNTANETGSGPPTFEINPTTGDIIWDAPGVKGQYNIAFNIIEWRNKNGIWYKIGYVTRDMQILIDECDNKRPELEIPEDLCVEAGTLIDETVIGTDPDGDDVKIEIFSQLFTSSVNRPIFTPNSGLEDFRPQPAESKFEWQTECTDAREQPYQVIFKITDRPESGPRLVTFETWNITVIGTQPDLQSVVRDGREAELTFVPYGCDLPEKPVEVQIWRRVTEFPFTPDECETGLPDNSGYELIDEVDINATTYRDTNNEKKLAYGAQYCYRLIAVFPDPLGGESIVSEELCIDPVLVSAPTITHVDIENTDESTGTIRVSWRSPFELDLSAFTLPLQYRVSRNTGLTGNTFETVATLSDTTYLDANLNTTDDAYSYKVTVLDATNTEIETSVAASSVRLGLTPEFERIQLSWRAEVPWSNSILGALHEVYRDNIDANNPSLFVKLADVEVTADGLSYLDEGQINETPLDNTEEYCYYVIAKGSYGNPLINNITNLPPNSYQINKSQIICGQPSDSIPPCSTTLRIDILKCRPIGNLSGNGDYPFDNLPCGFADFKNVLSWDAPKFCDEDTDHYEIHFKNKLDGTYDLLTTISDFEKNADSIVYEHENIPSYKGCYKIKSVDKSGNKSEFSNEVCKDNCPNYVLPNVFTPNGDGKNDTFRAYSDLTVGGEGDEIIIIDSQNCSRFVNSVNFQVFNRWGTEVYFYNSAEAKENGEALSTREAILIDWDGHNNSGKELSTGVYFYAAEVEFDVLNPANKSQIIKGWVHLLK